MISLSYIILYISLTVVLLYCTFSIITKPLTEITTATHKTYLPWSHCTSTGSRRRPTPRPNPRRRRKSNPPRRTRQRHNPRQQLHPRHHHPPMDWSTPFLQLILNTNTTAPNSHQTAPASPGWCRHLRRHRNRRHHRSPFDTPRRCCNPERRQPPRLRKGLNKNFRRLWH